MPYRLLYADATAGIIRLRSDRRSDSERTERDGLAASINTITIVFTNIWILCEKTNDPPCFSGLCRKFSDDRRLLQTLPAPDNQPSSDRGEPRNFNIVF